MQSNRDLDPYQAPRANVEHSYEGVVYNDSGVFSTSGRIGRLRYVAYGLVIGLAIMLPAIVLLGILSGVMGDGTGAGIGMMVLGLGYLAVLIFSIILGVRRLHDLNLSGWMWLINLIPLVGTLFALYMLFAPGKEDANDYGNPPAPNPMWVNIVGWGSVLVIPAIGVLAAIALPAYQGYVEKAKAAQETQQSMDAVESQEEMDALLREWTEEVDEADEAEAGVAEQDGGDAAVMTDEELEKLLQEVQEGIAAEGEFSDAEEPVQHNQPLPESMPADTMEKTVEDMSQEELEAKMNELLKELEQAQKEVQQSQGQQ